MTDYNGGALAPFLSEDFVKRVKLLMRWHGAMAAEIGDIIEVEDAVADDICKRGPIAELVQEKPQPVVANAVKKAKKKFGKEK